MSPLVHALIRKFVALQLAVKIMHGPSLTSHTQPTPARIAFSITHGDTESDPCWGWLDMACETSMDLTTAALPTNRMHLGSQSKLELCYARLDMMRLVSYLGLLDQCLSFMGAAKLTQASFPVLVLQARNAGVRTARASLGDTLYKEHSTLLGYPI